MKKKIDYIELARYVAGCDHISIPDLQIKYGISYTEAFELMQNMLKREWVSAISSGIDYPVNARNINLRMLERGEVDDIIAALDNDLVSVFSLIAKEASILVYQADDVVESREKAQNCLNKLTELQLICCDNQTYRLCVTRGTADVIIAVGLEKVKMSRWSRFTNNVRIDTLRSMFDVLFD